MGLSTANYYLPGLLLNQIRIARHILDGIYISSDTTKGNPNTNKTISVTHSIWYNVHRQVVAATCKKYTTNHKQLVPK